MKKDNIILKIKPKALVHTFEGHGWERMVALSAHQMENPITVFGYHIWFVGKISSLFD